MPQTPPGALYAFYTNNGVVTQKPVQCDANGNLYTTASGGGDAVTLAAGAVAAGAYVAGSNLDGWDATQGTKADAAWASGAGSVIAILKAIAEKIGAVPAGATPAYAASGNEAAAPAVATLAAVASKTNYLTGFTCTGSGATAASVVEVTVAGILGGTLTYIFAVPAGVTLGATPLNIQFPQPIAASAADVAIVVTLPSLGSGNTNAAVVATGYYL